MSIPQAVIHSSLFFDASLDIFAVHRRCGERQVLSNADVQRLVLRPNRPTEIGRFRNVGLPAGKRG